VGKKKEKNLTQEDSKSFAAVVEGVLKERTEEKTDSGPRGKDNLVYPPDKKEDRITSTSREKQTVLLQKEVGRRIPQKGAMVQLIYQKGTIRG